MMKSYLTIISAGLALLASGVFYSCSADYEEDFAYKELEVPHSDQAHIYFQRDGGERTINVTTRNITDDEWTATSNASWLTVTKNGNVVTVSAPQYTSHVARQAEITIEHGAKSEFNIPVTQFGEPSIITVDDQGGFFTNNAGTVGYFPSYQTEINLPLVTNMNVDQITVPDSCDWLTLDTAGMNRGELGVDSMYHYNVKFHAQPNTSDETRFCTLQFQTSDDWNQLLTVVLQQKAYGYYVQPVYRSTQAAELGYMPGKYRVLFERDATDGEYTITIPEEAKSWLSAPEGRFEGNDVLLTAALNTGGARSADIVLTPSNNSADHTITYRVTQAAFEDVQPIGVNDVTASGTYGSINVNWKLPSFETANFTKIRITAHSDHEGVPDIVMEVPDSVKSAVVKPTYRFANDYTITVTTVGAKGKTSSQPQTVTAQSNRWSEEIPVELTAGMLSTNSESPDHPLSLCVDGNDGTFFSTSTTDPTNDGEPAHIDIHLASPVSGQFRINFRQNTDNNRWDPTAATIFGSNDGVNWETIGNTNYRNPTTGGTATALQTLDTKGESYSYIRFQPTKRRTGANTTLGPTTRDGWRIAELLFVLYHDEAWKQAHLND